MIVEFKRPDCWPKSKPLIDPVTKKLSLPNWKSDRVFFTVNDAYGNRLIDECPRQWKKAGTDGNTTKKTVKKRT